MITRQWMLTGVWLLLALTAAVAPPPPPPGAPAEAEASPVMPDEEPPTGKRIPERIAAYQKMYDDKLYAELLEGLNARLAEIKRKKEQATPYELSRIHVFKAESHLRLRSQQQAIAAFKEASAFGVERDKARMTATVLLLQRSKQLEYSPKTGDAKGKPIDVIDDRKSALNALYADELERVKPKVASRVPQTLPQVFQVVETVGDLRTFELAATGNAEQTAQLLQPAGRQASDLMKAALAEMETEAAAIKRRANDGHTVFYGRNGTFYPKGLNEQDKSALNAIIDSCGKIQGACAALAPTFPAEAAQWQSMAEKSGKVREAAAATRDDKYRQRPY